MKLMVEHIWFHYPNQDDILRDVTMEINKGEIVAILGKNGIGKSTLLKCLLGIECNQKGNIVYDNVSLRNIPQKQLFQKVAYVPQRSTQTFSYSVLDTVLMGRTSHLSIFSQPTKNDEEIALNALNKVGLLAKKYDNISTLSGGELQLVYIARALCTQPSLLILDEPETGLDYHNQLKILALLESLQKDSHISIILNTHYPEHALRIATKSLLMYDDFTYEFGQTKNVLIPENLSKCYDVHIETQSYTYQNRTYTALFPFEERDSVYNDTRNEDR